MYIVTHFEGDAISHCKSAKLNINLCRSRQLGKVTLVQLISERITWKTQEILKNNKKLIVNN